VRQHSRNQRRPVPDRRDHLVAVLGQQPDQPFPQQHRVVGHHNPQRPAHVARDRFRAARRLV